MGQVRNNYTVPHRASSLPPSLSLRVCLRARRGFRVYFNFEFPLPHLFLESNAISSQSIRKFRARYIYTRDHRSKSYSTLWNDSKGLERIEFQRSFGEQFVERRSSTRGSRCNKTAKRVEKQGRTTVTDEREQQQKEEGGRARYRGRPFSRLLAPRPK